ncbi:MAG: hypothetical protein IPG45_01170 [Deltaproteobacteria bacterium]|nr:hypothetical protein [Deltaproteobacteria bacterium]
MRALPLWLIFAPTLAHAAPVEDLRGNYDQARAQLELERRYLSDELARAQTPTERAELFSFARGRVLATLDQALIPAWEGTPWSFSGTSERPGEGQIACGFFVGTLLEHAGFRVDRLALGRLASEHIAKSLAGPRSIRRYSDVEPEVVAADLLKSGPGLYAIGLDFHAAWARVTDDGQLWFIHSTVYGKGGVLIEPLLGDNPFFHSRYRVVAKLLGDRMMESWLEAKTIEARAG